jgi:hypothetical protein
MAVRIPLNLIITSKYTMGNEYLVKSTYADYQGYYYELNGNVFAGKTFNPKAPILIAVGSNKVNDLLINPETSTYGSISKINVNPNDFNSSIYNESSAVRYYAKKINSYPILIKEINKDTYNKLQLDPLYQTTSVIFPASDFEIDYVALDKADQQMPGLKAFILS